MLLPITDESGIYMLKLGPYFYFGQTDSFRRRWTEHLRHLRGGKHYNPVLRRVFESHPDYVPEMFPLELVRASRRNEFEQPYLDHWVGHRYCTNIAKVASNPALGLSWTDERKAAQKERKLRYWEELDRAERQARPDLRLSRLTREVRYRA